MRTLLLFCSLWLSLPAAFAVEGEFIGAKVVDSLPNWFKTTFLDLTQDLEEAKQSRRHVMIYFHQNGCPYCAKLVDENFHDRALVAKLQQNFDVIETNMWGDRELTDWQNREFSEKEFAAFMKIQFTPTLLFLNDKGETVLRLNGYQSIEKMHVALDYVAGEKYRQQTFANYLGELAQKTTTKTAQSALNQNPVFEQPPHILTRNAKFQAQQYLAVFFETPDCPACDKFHRTLMPLKTTQNLLKSMQVVQLDARANEKIITPNGRKTTAAKWYENLRLTYLPAIVFFDKQGQEIIRKDAFFKAYHLQGIMSYVSSGAYQTQPNFQRYLEDKSDKLRAKGVSVDIWQ